MTHGMASQQSQYNNSSHNATHAPNTLLQNRKDNLHPNVPGIGSGTTSKLQKMPSGKELLMGQHKANYQGNNGQVGGAKSVEKPASSMQSLKMQSQGQLNAPQYIMMNGKDGKTMAGFAAGTNVREKKLSQQHAQQFVSNQ